MGDTGVGKSGLAQRLVHGSFVVTKSSHARKAHILKKETVEEPSGVALHREIVLWDLAGQPAYRLVHQLSMEDAVLACVLFDCRNETNPFEGPLYWSQALQQARTNAELKKILVAARIDVGGLPDSRERIDTFARDNGFEGAVIATSALNGEGCDELLSRILENIPWDEVPTITTTDVLAQLRKYVAELRQRGDDPNLKNSAPALMTIAELHQGFVTHYGEEVSLNDFVSHLQRLEHSDDLDLLVFETAGATPQTDDLVLLDPTRVDAYASALLVAAKDEPDGPGHLLESRIHAGQFKLDAGERIPDRMLEAHLLWYVLESLLDRELALREEIQGQDYIVFPSQCTAELAFPGAGVFGVAYGFAGPVQSIYATLIAQLAHYEGFRNREFFHDAAIYQASGGGRCVIRFRNQGGGRAELEVLFDPTTPKDVRQGFLKFVFQHLQAKSKLDSVTKRHAFICANEDCRERFDDRAVQTNIEKMFNDLICPFCRKTTPLVDVLRPPDEAAQKVAEQIDDDAKVGKRRMTHSLVIKAKESEGKFDLFLSHNSGDKEEVEKIAIALKKKGIRAWLDKWHLQPGEIVIDAMEHAIDSIPCAALCFGPADLGKWHIVEIRAYIEKWASKSARMLPVILPGVENVPELPLFVRQTLWVDMRNWEKEGDDSFYRLICGIVGRAPGDSPPRRFGVREVIDWQGFDF